MIDCVFCNIIRDKKYDIPSRYGVSFIPLNPVVPGHRLFIPRSHVKDAAENPFVTAETMVFASQYAKDLGGAFNLITSAGSAATQTVFHLHIHYVPRHAGDNLVLPWTKPQPEKTWRHLA